MGLLLEVLKPILLLSVLAFIVASYFTSDTYLYGRTFYSLIGIPHVAELVCGERKGQKLEECRVSVREALVPVYLHCMSPTNSLMACTEVRNLASAQTDAEKPTCLEETNAVTECQRETIKRELERRGFTPSEIGRLPEMFGGGGSLTSAGRKSTKGGGSGHKRSPDERKEPEHESQAAQDAAAPALVESEGAKEGHTEKENDAS